jgi:hypothetical protein
MSKKEILAPVYSKLDAALRSIGYSFESAVADIIDNSIDADATSVLVRLIVKEQGGLGLLVFDDGKGMSSNKLREAMRFGADLDDEVRRLGKFGLGMKLASLSQAKSVHVFSFDGTTGHVGMAWLEDGVGKGFEATEYSDQEVRSILHSILPDDLFKGRGTIVYWDDLYRVAVPSNNPEAGAQKLLSLLQNHLSLVFHRFLGGRASGKKNAFSIRIDILDQIIGSAGLPMKIEPLDPFGYDRSGDPGFPQELILDDASGLNVTLHIWPPKSTLPEYRLPGGASSRQGFYFYRNNRLIQGGGWNGIREPEHHMSLARVEIDVDPRLDIDVSLDVKKSQTHLPRRLLDAMNQGKTDRGITLKNYFGHAERAYRERRIEHKELPLVPGEGVPQELQKFLYEELRIDETDLCRRVSFKWAKFDEEGFFYPNPDEDTIYLNKEYRSTLLHGLRGSEADLPVFKCMLFFLLGESLQSERWSPKQKARLKLLDKALTRAAKLEMKNR